jgi:hypothetical protein
MCRHFDVMGIFFLHSEIWGWNLRSKQGPGGTPKPKAAGSAESMRLMDHRIEGIPTSTCQDPSLVPWSSATVPTGSVQPTLLQSSSSAASCLIAFGPTSKEGPPILPNCPCPFHHFYHVQYLLFLRFSQLILDIFLIYVLFTPILIWFQYFKFFN